MGLTLYKVLDKDGGSCHGGSLKWSLPKGKKPGDWHEVKGPLNICAHGLHLTTNPETWWSGRAARAFIAEADGVVGEPDEDNKVVARRVRLVREVTGNDFAKERGVRVARGTIDLGYGDGYGDGYGYGYGSGSGSGYGYGYGDGEDIVT